MDIGEAGTLGCSHFLIEQVGWFSRRHEKVSVETLKGTLDMFFTNDSFNLTNGCRVAFSGQLRPFLSMQPLQLHIAVI